MSSLLFDQNLSRRLPALLAAEYPGSEQVILAGLTGADDQTVWNYAAAHGLAIVSKDSDFQKLSVRLGPPPKVIWLRVGNGPTRDIAALLRLRVTDVPFATASLVLTPSASFPLQYWCKTMPLTQGQLRLSRG